MIQQFLAIDRAKKIDALQQEVILCEREIDRRLSGNGKTVEDLARKMLEAVSNDD